MSMKKTMQEFQCLIWITAWAICSITFVLDFHWMVAARSWKVVFFIKWAYYGPCVTVMVHWNLPARCRWALTCVMLSGYRIKCSWRDAQLIAHRGW
jgi:hypothetical protein